MGMAASQARLLSITARIHDVEYQAQSIQNAKIQLANQSDNAYKDYMDALDATTLTIKNMDGERIPANFTNLCGKNAIEVQGNARYALYNERGRLIVPDEILDGYEDYIEDGGVNDPATFALYMMGIDNGEDYDIDDIIDAKNAALQNTDSAEVKAFTDKLIKIVNKYLEDDDKITNVEDIDEIDELYNTQDVFKQIAGEILEADPDDIDITSAQKNNLKKDMEDYQACIDAISFKLFNKYASQIFEMLNEDLTPEDIDINQVITTDEFDYDSFNYYARMFQLIQQAGGAVAISQYNGFNGDAATDGDWLQNMIQCGKITIDLVTFSTKDGSISRANSGVSSDTYLEHTSSQTVDKKKVAKAEAEYEHRLKDINNKDKKFDMDLSKLETERTALTTEYESVKKVISDNIERTFGIFS